MLFQVHSWFQSRKEDSAKASENVPDISGASPPIKAVESSKTLKGGSHILLTTLNFLSNFMLLLVTYPCLYLRSSVVESVDIEYCDLQV